MGGFAFLFLTQRETLAMPPPLFCETRRQLSKLVARTITKSPGDLATDVIAGIKLGRRVQLRRHLLEKSLVAPADVKEAPGLERLNALDRVIAFTHAARQRAGVKGPHPWTDAGLGWLAARAGLLLAPRDWPPPGGVVAAWARMESRLLHLLGKVPRFFADDAVRELEAAHLGTVWNALSARILVLHQPVPPPHPLRPGTDRLPGVPAWTVLTLTRNPHEADPKASAGKRLPKLELCMNDLVAAWWREAGGAAAEWSIGKTVEKWDQPPPRGACDPFSELLALCLLTGDWSPLSFAAEHCGCVLLPVESPAALPGRGPLEICAALHRLGAALSSAAHQPSPAATADVMENWHPADAIMRGVFSS